MNIQQTIEDGLLVIRIPLSSLNQLPLDQVSNVADSLKNFKGKTRAFFADMKMSYRKNWPISRRDETLTELAHKHRVNLGECLKQFEARGLVRTQKMTAFPYHIQTFVIL